MTQVQMSDHQLNRKLAELMGYSVQPSSTQPGRYRMVNPSGKQFGISLTTEEEVWFDYAFPYSTDHAASLEVQAKAIEVDGTGYVRNLEIAKWGKIMAPLSRKEVSVLLTTTHRERAEAAYITLSSVKE